MNLRTLLCITALCWFSLAQGRSFYQEGSIQKVSDGDTVWFYPDKSSWGFDLSSGLDTDWGPSAEGRLTIRMMGMDAPESHLPAPGHGMVGQPPWGDWSTSYLSQLVQSGKNAILHNLGRDKYGRTLGFIFRKDHDLNLLMVQAGWAIPYIICEGQSCNQNFWKTQRVREYLMACDEARLARRGIFDPRKPMKEMPFEFRLRMTGRVPEKYVGDYNTHKLYAPDKYKSVDLCRRIFFLRKNDAIRMGFK